MTIRSNQPLENSMAVGDYYRTAYSVRFESCHFCKERHHVDEMKEFHAGFACASCSTECPLCEDWLAHKPETIVKGQRVHVACEVDAILDLFTAIDFMPLEGLLS